MTSPTMEPRDLRLSSDEERRDMARRLYDEIGPEVLRLGYRYFGSDAQTAEDLVAETFGRVIAGLAHFQGNSAYRTWVFRIAMNVAAEWTRRRHSRAWRENESAREAPCEHEQTGLNQLLDRERDRLVRRALLALSADHRMVLSLVAVKGLKHAEVSDLLGVPEGTLWSRYARARVAFARELANLGISDPTRSG